MSSPSDLAKNVDVTLDESALRPTTGAAGNRPAREDWFRDQALGLFIHWGVDSQIGSVISHGLVGASDRVVHQYFHDLPRTFHPRRFHADDFARLARLAGMKYAVFTAKHHAGFCMWDTATTPYNVMQTPYGRDLTRPLLDAFRAHDLAAGLYFSPLDFRWLHDHGKLIQFLCDDVRPETNPGLMAYNLAQLEELFTGYGPVDLLFLDGPPARLRDRAWALQPDVLVTRGAMHTPEQLLPDAPLPGPWEACHTLGTQWNYKATNERYKTGTELIRLLVETRAKGGNLLLNVGPDPYGCIPTAQEELLRELGLWLFYNHPAIYTVRPWHHVRDGDIWFTAAKDGTTLYAIDTGGPWPYGEWQTRTLTRVRATERTRISLLGQNERVIEHQYDVDVATRWTQDAAGLHLTAMRTHRPYNDRTWPNPVVFQITHAVPA